MASHLASLKPGAAKASRTAGRFSFGTGGFQATCCPFSVTWMPNSRSEAQCGPELLRTVMRTSRTSAGVSATGPSPIPGAADSSARVFHAPPSLRPSMRHS